MKKLTMAQWGEKYITGPVEQFDQRNTMFNRPDWDLELRNKLDNWMFTCMAKDKPGFQLEDYAIKRATMSITRMFRLFNTSKPNPERYALLMKEALGKVMPPQAAATKKPPEGTRIDASDTQRLSLVIKKIARYYGADLVGICKLDRRWVYSHTYDVDPYLAFNAEPMGISKNQEIPETYQYAIVMAYEMNYDLLKHYNCALSGGATGFGYSQMAFTNAFLAEYIRNLGYNAIDCTHNDVALSVPLAMQAGLGELGRHGILITPQYGPRIRISKVLTDLPLEEDAPISFGVTEFCEVCKKCAHLCPSQSISYGNRNDEVHNISNARGARKWAVNAETCRMYWAKAKRDGGCSICISVCPYNKVNTWPHRFVRLISEYMSWIDPFLVKCDDFLGYGRALDPKDFWCTWKPS